jgi:phage antirepressor YoqD-like protein
MNFIDEPNLYRCIFQSRKKEAEQFQDWVCDEVLPSIRKNGGYMVSQPEETPEEIMARALLLAQRTIEAQKVRADYEAARAERLEFQNEEQKEQLQISAPKVQYYDDVMDSTSLITTNKIALDLGISAIKLNRILCEKQVQYNQSGTYMLFAKYRDKGYAKTRPHTYTDSQGNQKTHQHLYWTEKGKEFIFSLFNSNENTKGGSK